MQAEKPLVLIADDERNAVQLLTHIFERDGFAVDSARDGEMALEKARTLRPDLILLDVQMPRLNGFQVVEQLREDPLTARIPIIFVTAAAREPSDVAHGFKLGADDYIRKPYNYHELLARAHSKMLARKLEDRLQKRTEELESLVRIGAELNQRLSLDELTDLILALVREELKTEHIALLLFDERRAPILYQDERGLHTLDEAEEMLARPDTLVKQAYESGEPVLIAPDDLSDDDAVPVGNGWRSGVAAPLKHHGRLVGILAAVDEEARRFGETDLRLLRSIGEQAALAVRNAQLYAELQSYAQNLESMVEERTKELRAAQAQLIRSEKLAALGRLAAGIAHEVNNPLQPILGCLEVAIEDIESGSPVDVEVLRVAEKEVQRIKVIVSRLLDFARPKTSDTSEFNLEDMVREVLTLAAKQLERMRVRVQTRFAPLEPIKGNSTQLKQVFLNLILNAMEAMPEGGTLTVELYPREEGVTLAVEDTGIGMDRDTIAQIFDPFYSTKDEGTGLGLAVTYGIVEGHGGEIGVESEPGKGSRFEVWLPQRPA